LGVADTFERVVTVDSTSRFQVDTVLSNRRLRSGLAVFGPWTHVIIHPNLHVVVRQLGMVVGGRRVVRVVLVVVIVSERLRFEILQCCINVEITIIGENFIEKMKNRVPLAESRESHASSLHEDTS
jgi:hypothetical protein